MSVYLKRSILFFSFFCFLFSNFNSYRAKAIAPVAVVAGLEISGEAIVALSAVTLVAGGAVVDYANGTDSKLLKKFGDDLIATGQASQYLGVQINSAGDKILTWTTDGLSWLKSELTSVGSSPFSNGSIGSYSCPFNSSNTLSKLLTTIGTISLSPYQSYTLTGSDWSYVGNRRYSSSSVTYTIKSDQYYNSQLSVELWSSDGSAFLGNLHNFTIGGDYSFSLDVSLSPVPSHLLNDYSVCPDVIGFSTSKDSTGADVLPSTGVPLTGSVDDTGTTVYNPSVPIPYGKTWGDISADLGITYPNTDTGTGVIDTPTTGTVSDTGVLSIPILGDILKALLDILQFLKDLIGNFITALTKMITDIFVPSDTFFTDEFNKLKTPVVAKFPQNLDILNSLKIDGFQFSDIKVTIMGATGVIISSRFVNENINFIRAITSCFWVFLLVMYVWRKINQFLTGNEVIQPVVRDKGGH